MKDLWIMYVGMLEFVRKFVWTDYIGVVDVADNGLYYEDVVMVKRLCL